MERPIVVTQLTGGMISKKMMYIRNFNSIFCDIETVVGQHIQRHINIVGHDIDITKILLPKSVYQNVKNIPTSICGVAIFENTLSSNLSENIVLLNDVYYANHFPEEPLFIGKF